MFGRNRLHGTILCISSFLLVLNQNGICFGLIPPMTNTASTKSQKLSSSTTTTPPAPQSPVLLEPTDDRTTINNPTNTMAHITTTTSKRIITPPKNPPFHQKVKRRFTVYYLAFRLFLSVKLTQRRETKLRKQLHLDKSNDDHPAIQTLWSTTNQSNANRLLHTIQHLEGFWIKVGQYLSSRADILPPEYLETLVVLQDRMPPKGFEGEVLVTLREELGGREGVEELFEWVDEVPLSTASLAQVHRATLRAPRRICRESVVGDGGEEDSTNRDVVLKVQHRGVSSLIRQDMSNLKSILTLLARLEGPEADYTPIFTEYSKEITAELDFRKEATNMSTIRQLLLTHNVKAIVPALVEGLDATEKVLVMEYCPGVVIRDVGLIPGFGEVEKEVLVGRVVRAWAVQMHVGGIFNADPHPGNILVSTAHSQGDDGDGDVSVPVLLDFGLTKRLSPRMKLAFARMMHASESNDLDALLTSFDEMGLKMNREDPFEDMAAMQRSFGSTVPKSEAREASKKRSKEYKERQEAMKVEQEKEDGSTSTTTSKTKTKTKKATKLKNPVDAWPSELIFFGRVTNMLRGLCSGLEIRYPYMETMAVAARQTLVDSVPIKERATELIYSPIASTTTSDSSVSTAETESSITTTLQDKLTEAIHQLQNENKIIGLQVTVISNNKILANIAAGTIGTANPRPITPSTLFCIFSISKAILTIGILRLLQDGKIRSLDDPIADYWPEFANAGKGGITVRHVLGHRAGLANSGMPDGVTVDSLSDFEGMVGFMEGAVPEHGAGEEVRYHYLTFAWIVGGLIEKVTGRKYEDYLSDVIAGPEGGTVAGGEETLVEMTAVPSRLETFGIYLGGIPKKMDTNRLAVLSMEKTSPPPPPPNTNSHDNNDNGKTEVHTTSKEEKTNNVKSQPSEGEKSKKDPRKQVLAKYRGREQMLNPSVFNMRKVRGARIPSANGHASAFALATLFDSLVSPTTTTGGRVSPLESHIVDLAREVQPLPSSPSLSPSASREKGGDSKQAMLSDGASFGLGFQSHSFTLADGRIVQSIGHSGLGGSILIAIPEANLTVAVVINKLSMKSVARDKLLKIVFDEFGLSYPFSLGM